MMAWNLDAGHMIELFIAGITFWGIAWSFRREDRRKAKRSEEEKERKQDQRHQENQKSLEKISTHLLYNPPHIHTEWEENGRSVPLTTGGIRFAPKMRNGS